MVVIEEVVVSDVDVVVVVDSVVVDWVVVVEVLVLQRLMIEQGVNTKRMEVRTWFVRLFGRWSYLSSWLVTLWEMLGFLWRHCCLRKCWFHQKWCLGRPVCL